MEYVVYKEVKERYKLTIVQDDNPINPYKDCDFFGTLVHWYGRGFIGEDWSRKDREEIQGFYDNFQGVILPVYLYEHGGKTINTSGFSCPWDSGQVGFIYVASEKIAKEYGADNAENREKAKECLRSEVKTLDDYLRGNVWSFVVTDENDNAVDSCGGFFGDCNGDVLDEGRHVLEWHVNADKKARCERLKEMIRNHVPLYVRQAELCA